MPLALRLAALALAAAALPAFADSLASSASGSLSVSSDKISNSLSDSSQSSSNRDARNAQGDYKVIDVAEVADRPGVLKARLHAVDREDEFFLTLPREAAANGQVAAGAVVTAMQRPYGIEFATGGEHRAFFLALADQWADELESKAL